MPDGISEPQHEHQGFQYADYVLLVNYGYPLAVVEAKKKNFKRCQSWSRASSLICREYSEKFRKDLFLQKNEKPLSSELINKDIAGCPYQIEAIYNFSTRCNYYDNGTVGRSAVIPSDMPLSINTKHLAALTSNESKANPYFISIQFTQIQK